MTNIILAILLTINGDHDLTREERVHLLTPVAEAIAKESRNKDEIAFLIAVGQKESHFARYVLEGRCKEGKYKCDIDPKTGEPRAVGPWQIWRFNCGFTVSDYAAQARCALRRARFFQRMCGSWRGTFSTYAGRGCFDDNPRWDGRETLRRRILAKLG